MLYEGKVQFDGTPEALQKSTDPVVQQFITGRATGADPACADGYQAQNQNSFFLHCVRRPSIPAGRGQCRECSEWNTLVEEKVVKPVPGRTAPGTAIERHKIPDISLESSSGFVSGIAEFDRVIGGALLPGMSVLIGGEPGIGKSTLLLQVADAYSRQGLHVAYITGEESLSQIRLRAERLGVVGENVTAVNANSLEEITAIVGDGEFQLVLIDSIQTVSSDTFDSPPGTVAQVREAAHRLIMLAHLHDFSLFLVGHVTKEGMVAGPKVLEHMVDTVIYFEGDSSTHLYRMLRATKNRFGSVAEIGLFEMQSKGLIEVTNPSSLFLSKPGR